MSTTNIRNSTLADMFISSLVAENIIAKRSNGVEFPVVFDKEYLKGPDGKSPDLRHFLAYADVYGIIMKTIADALSTSFFKCKAKSALVFQKDSGEILAAAISDYDAEGENYFYTITFDPEAVKTISKDKLVNYTDFVNEITNANIPVMFHHIMLSKYKVGFTAVVNIQEVAKKLIMVALESLYHWLDINAKSDEIVELEITGPMVFEELPIEEYEKTLITLATASVEVVKDVKKMSITFGEELKAIAKGSNDINS